MTEDGLMKKVRSHTDILSGYLSFHGKTVLDVGCGTGDFVRWLTKEGTRAIGVDTAVMVGKALAFPRAGNEIYRSGTAQDLPYQAAWTKHMPWMMNGYTTHFRNRRQRSRVRVVETDADRVVVDLVPADLDVVRDRDLEARRARV